MRAVCRLVTLASLVVLVDTVFYAVVVPLLPTYASELGLSKGAAGILGAGYAAGTLLGSVPAGALAGRIGPRATVICGLLLLGMSSLVFGLGEDIVLLDLARVAQGVGGACSWAGALAWIVRAAPADRRGTLIGTVLGVGTAGALLGPVVGGVAEATSRTLVFSLVLPLTVALALVAGRVRTPPLAPEPPDGGLRGVGEALGRRDVRSGMWLITLPAISFGAIGVVGSLRLDTLGATAAAVAGAFLVAAAAEAAVAPIAGRLSDRFGRLAPVRIGLAAGAVVAVLVCLPRSAWAFAAAIVVLTVCLSLLWAPAMAIAADAAEASGLRQGAAFGLVNLAWAGGQTLGSAGSGALAEGAGDAVPFLLAAALCAGTLAWLRATGARIVVPAGA